MNADMSEYAKERDEALLALNEKKIRKFFMKYGIRTTDNKRVFWASVHKIILYLDSATEEQKTRSKQWLIDNGFKPYI